MAEVVVVVANTLSLVATQQQQLIKDHGNKCHNKVILKHKYRFVNPTNIKMKPVMHKVESYYYCSNLTQTLSNLYLARADVEIKRRVR